jgi:superfamily II DNA or RNA helicase
MVGGSGLPDAGQQYGSDRPRALALRVHGKEGIGSPVSRRDQLVGEIEAVEALLARLAGEESQARSRLAALRADLACVNAAQTRIQVRLPPTRAVATPTTPEQKVGLFRQLFGGRQDVFPTRFVSKKTGKPGYAPACTNKFVRGVCELPRIKCGECPNQAFVPVDDVAVLAHLRGQHVMGVYPLLEDETCWFLAVDFDKKTWVDDVAAFVATCRDVGLLPSVERSRSGNGAHVWFFFSEPIPASAARKMGCYLITETMSRRHELTLDSYDRLFPSQDTMPRGGFGNLIALPLQHGPRQHGNSAFLDDHLQPYPDDQQWAQLASVQRIDRRAVEAIAGHATRQGSVLGVRAIEVEDEDSAPWTRPPSGRPEYGPIVGPLPPRIRAVLAQRLFVEKAGLPSALLNQVKRLAAFQNPEFYKKQSMRLSTALTPRVIGCAEDLPQHVALPRGLRPELEGLLGQHGVALEVEDKRESGTRVTYRFQGALTDVQKKAVRALLAHEIGAFVAPPGVGKTIVGTYLVAERGCSTLILVHRQPLLDQWLAQLSLFLGVDVKEIGQIGAGKRAANGRLDVAMIQSLVRSSNVADLVASYGQVIVDECHHVPAASFERVLAEVKARYVVGLTATPQRRDGLHPIIEMQIGPARFTVDPKSHAARRPFEHRLIVRETRFTLPPGRRTPSVQELHAALAADEKRNEMVLNDALACLEERRSPILLTERRDHLEYFAEKLRKFTRHLVVLHGGMTARARKAVTQQLGAIPSDEERLVLATGRYIGEGFDDPRLDTLLLALPVSWKGTLVQYTGRLHRLHPGKTEVRIYDYVDREVTMLLRMFERRLRGYRAIGYARDERPLGFAEASETVRVEDDAAWPFSTDG